MVFFSKVIWSMVIVMVFPRIRGPKQYLVPLNPRCSEWIRRPCKGCQQYRKEPLPVVLDSYSKWIRQKIYQFFINRKLKKILYFVICILTNNMPHEIIQIFWKSSQFENMMASFLLRCQNSLRWEICLICHWNIDPWKQKFSFGYVMVPKSNQKII